MGAEARSYHALIRSQNRNNGLEELYLPNKNVPTQTKMIFHVRRHFYLDTIFINYI
jgi:hypothetical protein